MDDGKGYTQLSVPIQQKLHTNFKVLVNANGTTIRKVAIDLIREYTERPENKKKLAGLN